MIERLIEYSCRNKFLIIALFVAVTGWGYYVMRHTPVDAIPDLSENQVIVFTDWMGRSPQEIEDQITYPLSVNLQGLAGVKAVRASSEFNFSMINIIFDDSVDFYFARNRVLERLALAGTFLPQGVVPYLAPDATALGQIFWYTVEGENTDAGTLRALQDWYVRYQLNAVPGVAQVGSVGGFPKEYQVDVTPEKLRAYGVTLGDIFSALARSNSSVGGRVVHKGNAEYLIRGVGWLKSLDDIRNTVITERKGVPIRVGDLATVQTGSEFRRSVLEKDGSEVTGGVVMMRYGENPLEVTRSIKAKIRDLQRGLPEGVRIVPFYDRTRLVESAIHTVTTILEHEILIATLAILLILTHFRSVFVIVLTLPLSILIAFILMRYVGISSNIMSLSGIAISIGILVDQAIVMLENATHHLTLKFGENKITGDTTEIVAAACRQVGRPIFFSVVIMVLSFLPVFALSGQEGKLFHPLAFTKTFALIGTAIISVTLVPAIIPLLIRGRLSREEKNWVVRSVVAIYRPMLGYLMQRPKTVIWLMVVLWGLGFYFARHLGREFMPPLDEGSIMDMPVTSPRASVTEAADDLKARDALLREMPEIEQVVGKAGRADTPTDPSPLDMVETIVNLRPREHWLKRKLLLQDALAEAGRQAQTLEHEGVLGPFASVEQRRALLSNVASAALEGFDAAMRRLVVNKQANFAEQLADVSARFVGEKVLEQLGRHPAWRELLGRVDRETFLRNLVRAHRGEFVRDPLLLDVQNTVDAALAEFKKQARAAAEAGETPAVRTAAVPAARVAELTDPLAPVPSRWDAVLEPLQETFGQERRDFYEQTALALDKLRSERTEAWVKQANGEIFYPAMEAYERALFAQLEKLARMEGAGRTSGPSRSSTAWTCSPRACARRSASSSIAEVGWSREAAEIKTNRPYRTSRTSVMKWPTPCAIFPALWTWWLTKPSAKVTWRWR
ncbi:MAG: efflux RND transporter permease subunit [Planctomycetota bacterium]